MAEVYVPGVGFRSADGLGIRERAVLGHGERALAVLRLTSTQLGTEIAFEVKDDSLERQCLSGEFDHRTLHAMDVRLRDERGRAYARSTTLQEGIGVGQHEFGFFSRELGFEPLPRDVRRVVLEAHGVLGDWEVPIDLVPLRETRVAAKHDIDASASLHGITIRVSGIAFTDEATVVELEAEASGVSVRAIGAEFQRQGEDRVAIVDEEGRRYMEELSRETVQRPRNDPRRTYAKLPPVRRDAPDLSVIVPAVVVADSQATLEVALPVTEPRTVMFGTYPVQLRTALVDDIPSAPGKPSDHGLRVALGAASVQEPRRFASPLKVFLDDKEHSFGTGWHPEPGMRNYQIVLDRGVAPSVMRLVGATARLQGPWEIRFGRPTR